MALNVRGLLLALAMMAALMCLVAARPEPEPQRRHFGFGGFGGYGGYGGFGGYGYRPWGFGGYGHHGHYGGFWG